jgi:uncharacterized membrane protein YjjB (DUF3815 family)
VAATVAGLIGAAAMHLDLGAAAGLVAVCPGMVLVPGPHILNGALDLLALRITLGIARFGYATLILLAIAAGLILGLRLGGQTLSVTGVVRTSRSTSTYSRRGWLPRRTPCTSRCPTA